MLIFAFIKYFKKLLRDLPSPQRPSWGKKPLIFEAPSGLFTLALAEEVSPFTLACHRQCFLWGLPMATLICNPANTGSSMQTTHLILFLPSARFQTKTPRDVWKINLLKSNSLIIHMMAEEMNMFNIL